MEESDRIHRVGQEVEEARGWRLQMMTQERWIVLDGELCVRSVKEMKGTMFRIWGLGNVK